MTLNKLTGAMILAFASQAASASGFALIEQSASGQGLSYAGAAANAEDASVMWFNPAGLTEISGSQGIVGGHLILPSSQFTNKGSSTSTPSTVVGDGNGSQNGIVPNLYWKGDMGGHAVGLAINVPFGSKVDYKEDWAGRYQATGTELKTVNLNASIAKKLNASTSVGFGLNAQYVHLIMSQKIDQTAFGAIPDGNAEVDATSLGFGFNAGVLSHLSEKTVIGASYRSAINHSAKGTVDYTGVLAPVMAVGSLVDGSTVGSDVTLPASASISVVHKVNNKLELLADATWTGWSAYDELVVTYDSGAEDSASAQAFKDSMRYAVGAAYQLNDTWKLRGGLALDNTPVPDAEHRSPRTPDTDKTWISAGFNYKLKKSLSVDVGYSHLIGGNGDINKTVVTGTGSSTLLGSYDTTVDILSAQLVWKY